MRIELLGDKAMHPSQHHALSSLSDGGLRRPASCLARKCLGVLGQPEKSVASLLLLSAIRGLEMAACVEWAQSNYSKNLLLTVRSVGPRKGETEHYSDHELDIAQEPGRCLCCHGRVKSSL
jgi:hypothetical protein